MSTTYPHLTGTQFPDKIDSMVRMSDLEIGDLKLADDYYKLYNAGNLTGARQLLQNNPQLNNKIFNSDKFNKLMDALIAVQQLFRDDIDGFTDDVKDKLIEYIDEFTYRDYYSATTKYYKKNIITYTDCSYICLQDCVGEKPIRGESTTYWAVIARGVQGESGLGLSPRGEWKPMIPYYKEDWVNYSNRIWECITDNIDSEPTIINSEWKIVMTFLPLTGVTWGELAGLFAQS